MIQFIKMVDTFLKFSNLEYSKTPEDLYVQYPSSDWTTLTWSYRLILDLMHLVSCPSNSSSNSNFLSGFFSRKIDVHSYHYDLTRKINLFHTLKTYPQKEKILIPEVGPCGFDVMLSVMAGFKIIHCYDMDRQFVDCCKLIWEDRVSSYMVSSSSDFEFENYDKQGFVILLPDWYHGTITPSSFRDQVASFDPENLKYNTKKINAQLLEDFKTSLMEL